MDSSKESRPWTNVTDYGQQWKVTADEEKAEAERRGDKKNEDEDCTTRASK